MSASDLFVTMPILSPVRGRISERRDARFHDREELMSKVNLQKVCARVRADQVSLDDKMAGVA